MRKPTIELSGVDAAYAALHETLDRCTDRLMRAPSSLPGWSRVELVTHLARNADANRRMAEGAIRGELIPQYAGGAEQREAEIRRGRGSATRESIADLEQAQQSLVATWSRMPDEAWDRATLALAGTRPAWRGVWARWREIEIHHVDLDLGYEPQDWPRCFVEHALASVVSGIPARWRGPAVTDGRSWLLQATDAGQQWRVVQRGATVEVTEGDGDEADAVVSGVSYALLAWLLGRRQPEQVHLTCSNDPGLSHSLPRRAPYP